MSAYGTGNAIVDEVGQLSITGDVTPRAWYQTVTREDGRPFLLAIAILSDVTYWYRPREVRDEGSSMVVRWERRFADERWLSRSYDQICDAFGCSRRECAYALKRLEEIGVIRRHTRCVRRVVSGVERLMTGVLFIELVPSVLRELTFPGEAPGPDDAGEGPEPEGPACAHDAEEAPGDADGAAGTPDGASGAPSGERDGEGETAPGPRAGGDLAHAAREMDALAPRKARSRFGELCREVAEACSGMSVTPQELTRAYGAYVATPDLWPGRDAGRMVRFALTWCRDRRLVASCLARARRAARAPSGARGRLPARERAESARLVRATTGGMRSWVAILEGPAETMELYGLHGEETEDEARGELLRELREREGEKGAA